MIWVPITSLASLLVSYLCMPKPSIQTTETWEPKPALPDPELPHDPSAFWRYPDWDGPIDEPFWMRPLKLPVVRDLARENYESAAMMYGTRKLEPVYLYRHHIGGRKERIIIDYEPAGSVFDYMLEDEELKPPKV